MPAPPRHPAGGSVSAVVVAIVFAVAVIGKLLDPASTVEVFTDFVGLSGKSDRVATISLVALEVATVGWLLSGLRYRASLVFTGVLLGAFTIFLAWQQLANWTGGCGCGTSAFGPDGDRAFGITRNVTCLGLYWLGWS